METIAFHCKPSVLLDFVHIPKGKVSGPRAPDQEAAKCFKVAQSGPAEEAKCVGGVGCSGGCHLH